MDPIKAIRKVMGYVQNGTSQSVIIGQDDATKTYSFTVGKTHLLDDSFDGLLKKIVDHAESIEED